MDSEEEAEQAGVRGAGAASADPSAKESLGDSGDKHLGGGVH